ncbi:DUF2062 family protein [Halanaeroarchaeum sp. HSR-CO]|uniref:DUF2062 domain-containing protein n=1 Tax=Halanaeroarchaeum sp. HSR-CO TaxID=2866382 RepID=UPI00217F1307|nr:DUF2062 domain-containing protein [Halanaeroarchaeum sp. HSR-CO]UWG47868.1 DUF2062 family protein [Halanaeroarchaeum sp. HSR-CO]
MVREGLVRAHHRVQAELESALIENHSSHEVALSFGIGVFITALPTLGTGFLAMAILVLLFRQLSKIAMLASVIVLNPVVKWGVYGSSYWLGQRILGPGPGLTVEGSLLSVGSDVLVRLWVGNFILAVAFAFFGYFVALRIVYDLRRRFDHV